MDDPLAFDMSKVLVFKMPKVTSIAMYNKVDRENPAVDFKDSRYYREKHHLGGFMDGKNKKELQNKIKQMGDDRRDCYAFSKDPNKQKKQVADLISRMDNAIEASRLEALLINQKSSVAYVQKIPQKDRLLRDVKLSVQGKNRLHKLINRQD